MSGLAGSDEDAPEMLAAEYVLGTLDLTEAQAAEARLAGDAGFAADVGAWAAWLYPLSTLVAPVPPPAGLWARIEESLGRRTDAASAPAPRIGANDNRLRAWRAAAFGGFAVAAGLAAVLLLRPAAPGAVPVFAVLAPAGNAKAVLVAVGREDGGLVLRPSAVLTVADGRDLQLWSLPQGAKAPASLGLLPSGGVLLPAGVAIGTQLLVSLEPKGGSPTGAPTGPVVYGGILRRAD